MTLTKEELEQLGKNIVDEMDRRKPTGPRRIDRTDAAEISRSLPELASGKAILVDMSEPRRKRAARSNEIDKDDQKSISENLAAIASGEKALADLYE